MTRSLLARGLLGLLSCGLALASSPARASTLADISPLYFEGAGGQGFDPAAVEALGRPLGFTATPDDQWLPAGDASFDPPLVIDQLGLTERQAPASPSLTDPIIADATWRVTNVSAGMLTAPLLVFTSVDPLGLYPIALPPTGLDADGLDLLGVSAGVDELVYGVIALPDLGEGESAQVTLRYVVGGAIAGDALPPLGVAILGSYTPVVVPEPSTIALVTLGLVALGAHPRCRARP